MLKILVRRDLIRPALAELTEMESLGVTLDDSFDITEDLWCVVICVENIYNFDVC